MFDFYFTGVSINSDAAEYLIKNHACVLLSQLNERSAIKKWIEKFKELGNVPLKLFIDSGAFSAWTLGKKIDVDDYIDFINTNKEYFEICASVDDIPGKPRASTVPTEQEVRQSCENTWQNFLYMRSKMEDVNKLLYTFHLGEPWEYLKRALEYRDDKGPINYIAFGGMVGKTQSDIRTFLQEATDIVAKSSNPDVKIHAFGMTNLETLEQYKLYSADSTSWVLQAGFGRIKIGNGGYLVSNQRPHHPDYILNKSKALQEEFLKIIKEKGFTLEQLSESHNDRALFNMMSYYEWAENYKYTPKKVSKIALF